MAKDTVVFRPGEKFGICAAIAAAADSPASFKSRESRESAPVSLISSDNPEAFETDGMDPARCKRPRNGAKDV